MDSAKLITKWNDRFADNTTGEISEADLREFVKDLTEFVEGTVPPVPAGITWLDAPVVEIVGTSVDISAAEYDNAGTPVTVAPDSKTVAFAAAGFKRSDVLGIRYQDATPYYDILTGAEVVESATAITPPLPVGFLAVAYLNVSDGSVSVAASNVVRSIKLPTGEVFKPNLLGQLLLKMEGNKFKGYYFDGPKKKGEFWVTVTGIWKVLQDFTSNAAPTANTENWQVILTSSLYGPYNSTAAAIAAIPSYRRYYGLTVGIKAAGEVKDYWWKFGLTDADLEQKTDVIEILPTDIPAMVTNRTFRPGRTYQVFYSGVNQFVFIQAAWKWGIMEVGMVKTLNGGGTAEGSSELVRVYIDKADGNQLKWHSLATGTIPYKTGSVVDFVAMETHFGSESAPEIGNITANTTGAVVGHMAFMTHKDSVAPAFSSEFHKVAGSGDYVPNVNNYIYFDYRSSTRILYSITQ